MADFQYNISMAPMKGPGKVSPEGGNQIIRGSTMENFTKNQKEGYTLYHSRRSSVKNKGTGKYAHG
jgi:hypothetical protein